MEWSIHAVPPGTYRVPEVFEGLEGSQTLRALFPRKKAREDFLARTTVLVAKRRIYGYVDDEDGSIVLGHEHLTKGDRRTVYLDILHELVHVKQFRDGRQLYDGRYRYVDRPTEVEAYGLVVRDARRLGMSDAEIADYLKVEWSSAEDHRRLCRRLGVRVAEDGSAEGT